MTTTIAMTRTIRYKSGQVLTKGRSYEATREALPECDPGWLVAATTRQGVGFHLFVGDDSAREVKAEPIWRHKDGLVWLG